MSIFDFTRQLMEIDSTTWQEGAAGRWLRDYLIAAGFEVTTQVVTEDRINVFARIGDPLVTWSSHIDTVPPYIPFSEDDDRIYGRGACDAKGIVAAQVFAALTLKNEGYRDIGLLYVVGEEDGSDGARMANTIPNRNRFLINGEPTESHQAIATKGAMRVVIEAQGRIAHSAYPELGESAIEKLLDVLDDLRRHDWPVDPELGPTTYNIGTIAGGRKPNVVPDFASSEVMFRTVFSPDQLFESVRDLVGDRVEVKRGFSIPPVRTHVVPGMEDVPTSVVRFGTDIPCLTEWGDPILFGPGSIHNAHTRHEFIIKSELLDAVDTFTRMGRILLQKAKE
ncbi:MAG: M20/M25/M40 family metallo-hydrolase [Blastocatellia bacterium]|jgi:acetylornithine deacetylase